MTAASPDPIEDRAREHLPAGTGWIPTDPGIVAAFARAEIARELRAQADIEDNEADRIEGDFVLGSSNDYSGMVREFAARLRLRADALDPQ